MNRSSVKNGFGIILQNKQSKISSTHNILKNLEDQFKIITTDILKLKEEHQTILAENIELKEKIRIFELNLAEYPNHTLSELNIEVVGITSKLKTHAELISKLEHELSLMRNNMTMIERKLEELADQIQSVKSSINKITPLQPVITTASKILDQKEKFQTPTFTAQIHACEQMLQILDNSFKEGNLTQDEYRQKRLKFEKKLAELQQNY